MKIASIAHQGVERILSTKYLPVSLMQNLVKACIKKLESQMEDNLDLDSRIMLKFCKSQRLLLSLYSSVSVLNSAAPEASKLSDFEILTNILRLSPLEAQSVITLLEHYNLLTPNTNLTKQSVRVKFKEDVGPLGATSFLHAFSYRTLFSNEDKGSETPSTPSSSTKQMQITVSKEASDERRLALSKFLYSGCLHRQCQTQELMSVIQKGNLPPDQLMSLLLQYWLSSTDHTIDMMANLYELIKAITALTDLSEVVVDSNESSVWWQSVRNTCSQSDNIKAAYLAVVTCRAAAVSALGLQGPFKDPDADTLSGKSEEEEDLEKREELKRHRKKKDDDKKDNDEIGGDDDPGTSVADTSTDSQDWESLTVDMELWEVLARQCEDAMAIVTLLNIQASQENNRHQPISVAVARLLHGGKGSIPEVIARYVVQQHLNPASLFYSFTTDSETQTLQDEAEEEEDVVGTDEVDSETSQKGTGERDPQNKEKTEEGRPLSDRIQEMEQSDKIKYQLGELRRRFPHTLHNDILLSNCCWEYAVLWNKEPEAIWSLEFSLEYLRLVQNAVLRQGVSSLLWHMFMKKRASSAAHLMEKVGKPPKERLCRKEVGMNDVNLVTFATLCADFMEIIMDANCEAHEVPVYNLEPAWQKMDGPTSLIELAVDQKATNYGLLRVHFHLFKIMSAVLSLGMKSVKVLSLFDNKGRAALFRELHSHPLLPSQKVEPGLISSRKNFLCRVISTAVSTIEPPATLDQSTTSMTSMVSSSSALIKRQRSLYPSAFKWPQVVQMLARDFGLDLDYFKRHHVCELFSYGHDKLGEEVMLSVNDHEEMGVHLLTIGGQRVAWEIFKRDIDRNFQHLAGMSTSLTRWLKNLEPDKLHCHAVPLTWTVLLLEHAATRLTEDSRHHDLAQELLEKTRTLAAFTSES
ncbi:Rab3 GTPase-activating protein non-catalytic subunit-like [Plakobranchus ocellatus]|uniref:Rab3 GTPase-activating protein non-catalytic subunit-like n=1 Tax=Plakobranchus ocellatus TaxID=259542 RepID=A0AAV4C407_9GAST|nr:Rab3 GTPase-activating protein non-catalytic subunit-like [Plakobranchus ocellatus]